MELDTPIFLPGESQGWWSLWAAVYRVAQSRTRLTRLCKSKEKAYKFPEPPSGPWKAEGSVLTCSITCQLVLNDEFRNCKIAG